MSVLWPIGIVICYVFVCLFFPIKEKKDVQFASHIHALTIIITIILGLEEWKLVKTHFPIHIHDTTTRGLVVWG